VPGLARSADCCTRPLGARRREGARRRHAGARARARRGKPKTGRLWVYVRAGRLVPLFARRKGEHPQAHLACYPGILQADA
jgi:hypothetical protein